MLCGLRLLPLQKFPPSTPPNPPIVILAQKCLQIDCLRLGVFLPSISCPIQSCLVIYFPENFLWFN